MSDILTSGSLKFTEPNCPTRAGEIINTISEIYDIPNPREGMCVFVRDKKKNYTILSLKDKIINGVLVPHAVVDKYMSVDGLLEDTRANAADVNTIGVEKGLSRVAVVGKALDGGDFEAVIPAATTEAAGVMSAEDKQKLDAELPVHKTVDNSTLNYYTNAGIYNINTNSAEETNLPITNTGEVSMRLVVLTSDNGSGNTVVTQVLSLNNNEGGEGNVYIRSQQNGTWKPWGKMQTNIEVGQVNTLDNLTDNGIYSGVWTNAYNTGKTSTFVCVVINDYVIGLSPRRVSQFVYDLDKADGKARYYSRVGEGDGSITWGDWEILNNDVISEKINTAVKNIVEGIDPEKLDSLKDLIAWVEAHGGEVAEIKNDIQENTAAIEAEAKRAKAAEEEINNTIAKEKKAIVNGDTIVRLAREVYSRQGKVDTATFLKRTTAGSTSVSDGVASVKQIGGNIVKNMTDLNTPTKSEAATYNISNGFLIINAAGTSIYSGMIYSCNSISGHKIYTSVNAFNMDSHDLQLGHSSVYSKTQKRGVWERLSLVSTHATPEVYLRVLTPSKDAARGFFTNLLFIDLTELFGAGNEPSKEECDKMFGTMDALPQGLSIAQPTGLKSTGYNQFNPVNVLADKTVTDNAIATHEGSNIAVVECLPCKTGAGENNGYVIGYGDGDIWSDEGVEVYLSPLNPMEVEGELYMHKLEKDTTYGTYVPQIKGYLLVVTSTTDKLCAHLHWSGDRAKTDYEEYIESNVALPIIPEVSEWGLAGISASGTLSADTIDLDRMVYTKRIGCVDASTLFIKYYPTHSIATYPFFTLQLEGAVRNSLLTSRYTCVKTVALNNKEMDDKTLFYSEESIYLRDTSVTSVEELKASLQGVMLYYELAEPEEYPIVTKTVPNYIGSDYGVEEFTGSKIPLAANILFYMRSLVGETRNFIDQLYTNTQKSDAKEVANYITNNIENNKQLATEAPNLALRALFVAAGAEYNDTGADKIKTAPWGETVTHKAGHYYLNGLGDITEEQMRTIYALTYPAFYSKDLSNAFRQNHSGEYAFRTNLRSDNSFPNNFIKDITSILYTNASVEVLKVCRNNEQTSPIAISYAFYGASKLKAVIGSLYIERANAGSFENCGKLQHIQLSKLNSSILLSQSSLISKESVLYMIQNAAPTTTITITLHPDAYTRLVDDADIVAALEAQPLVTLVSA